MNVSAQQLGRQTEKKGKNWMRRMILFAYVVKEKVI